MSGTRLATTRETVFDSVMVLFLVAVALIGLDGSFASRSYMVVGMVGAVVPLLLALIVRGQGRGTEVYLLSLCVAYMPLGGWAAMRSTDYLGFPSPAAMLDVLSGTLTAPAELLSTIPPVDPTGVVMVLPFALGFLSSAAASGLAVAGRSPAAPFWPLLAALVASILLGTDYDSNLMPRGLVFAAAGLWWMSLRGSRDGRTAHAHRGLTARVLVATLVVGLGAGLASWLVEDTEVAGTRTILRGHVGVGEEVADLDNPLAGYRKFVQQPPGTPGNITNAPLLRVTGLPEGVPLRFLALDHYDGTAWRAGNRTVPDANDDLFLKVAHEIAVAREGQEVEVSVEVKGAYVSSWLPIAGQLSSIDFDYVDRPAQREDVRYNPATSSAMVTGGLNAGDDYHFTAVLADTRLTSDMKPYGSGDRLQPAGAGLDRFLRPWSRAPLSRMRKLFSLVEYLRVEGRYSHGVDPADGLVYSGQDLPRLGRGFIGADRPVGDDEQYAAFVALAANRMGIPARVAIGGHPGPEGYLHGRDVQAWVEVRVADGTWRVLPRETFTSQRHPEGAEPPKKSADEYLRSREIDKQVQREERERSARDVADSTQERVRSWLPWLLVPALLILAIPLSKWWRRRRRRTSGTVTDRFVGGWREILDLARDQGRALPSWCTRPAQARLLGRGITLAERTDAHVYAPVDAALEAAPEGAAHHWQEVEVELRSMRTEVGPLRRIWAFWNPRSLLTGARSALSRARSVQRRDVDRGPGRELTPGP